MGLFDFFKSSDNKRPSIDLSDFKFLSDDHTRIENGRPTTANNKGAWRGIRVKTSDNQTFYATMYNMNENHPVWGDNIQMAEKQMKVIEETNDKIILRGFGSDAMGASFADYGLTLHKSNNNVTKVTLHMHDRNIDIVYQKSEESNTIKEKNDKEKIQKCNELNITLIHIDTRSQNKFTEKSSTIFLEKLVQSLGLEPSFSGSQPVVLPHKLRLQ